MWEKKFVSCGPEKGGRWWPEMVSEWESGELKDKLGIQTWPRFMVISCGYCNHKVSFNQIKDYFENLWKLDFSITWYFLSCNKESKTEDEELTEFVLNSLFSFIANI